MTSRLTVLWLVAAAAGGCSADPASSAGTTTAAASATASAAPAVKACDLLTSAEVTQVIGLDVLAPQANGFECAFRRQTDDHLLTRAVRLRLEPGTGSPYELFDQYTAAIRAALDGVYDPAPVAGVGSVAAWDGDALLTAEGLGPGRSVILVVQLDGVSPTDEQGYAEAIAQTALARLRTLP